MRVMVIVKADKNSEAGMLPDRELFAEMDRFNAELANAGIFLAGEGLHPTSKGKRVKFEGKRRTVIDGPFAESKELIAGFWLKKAPFDGGAEVEIRRVYEAEDLGDILTPEMREQDQRVRSQLAAKK